LCEATHGTDVETIMQGLHLDRRLSPRVAGLRIRPEILGYLRAGIGFGGSCLPKDVNALRVYGKRMGVATPMLDAVMDINTRRPEQIVAMADAAVEGLAGKTVALLGVAFKAGTDDLRSSPALALWRELEKAGARVKAYDPVVSPEAAAAAGLRGQCTQNLEEAVAGADAVLITMVDPALRTADWERLTASMRRVLIDGRNILRNVPLPAAVRYFPVGRGVSRNGHAGRLPSSESYVEQRRSAPLWKRLNRWRKTHARRLYRQSGQNLISKHALRAAVEIVGATLLQPGYTVPRLKGQILK
jgi:UDPglucose 6-dehydrogenase